MPQLKFQTFTVIQVNNCTVVSFAYHLMQQQKPRIIATETAKEKKNEIFSQQLHNMVCVRFDESAFDAFCGEIGRKHTTERHTGREKMNNCQLNRLLFQRN